jgi:hypothetical protein
MYKCVWIHFLAERITFSPLLRDTASLVTTKTPESAKLSESGISSPPLHSNGRLRTMKTTDTKNGTAMRAMTSVSKTIT